MNKRLFVGIPLGEEVIKATQHIRQENSSLTYIRWTSLAQLHLTTWFIGEVPEEMFPNLKSILQLICRRQKPFSLEFSHLYLSPNPRDARMLWAKYKSSPDFEKLIEKHRDLLGYLGIYERQFKKVIPHITLARFKQGSLSKKDFKFIENFPKYLWVKELVLWESTLHPSGAIYQQITKSILLQ